MYPVTRTHTRLNVTESSHFVRIDTICTKKRLPGVADSSTRSRPGTANPLEFAKSGAEPGLRT